VDFSSEREHNELLVSLIRELGEIDRLDVFEQRFLNGRQVGKLRWAKFEPYGRLFDVELCFDLLRCVIESKVDQDESGADSPLWQTERIYQKCRAISCSEPKDEEYLFITYGSSEFYIKKATSGRVGSGPACQFFRHIGLEQVAEFVRSAIDVVKSARLPICQFQEWLDLLEHERDVRRNAKALLRRLAAFRRDYLKIRHDLDFPAKRMCVRLPELAFPVFAELATIWNSSAEACRLGRVTVYPVSRNGINDSVLNFTELWAGELGTYMTCGGTLCCGPGKPQLLYFEVNEDFNLHLKLNLRKDKDPQIWRQTEQRVVQVKQYVHDRDRQLQSPTHGVRGRTEYYVQGSHVLYEWDFGLLSIDIDSVTLR